MKSWYDLSEEKQKELTKEFDKKYPMDNALNITTQICGFILIGIGIFFCLIQQVAAGVLFILLGILAIVLGIDSKENKKKEKAFKKWLEVSKKIAK